MIVKGYFSQIRQANETIKKLQSQGINGAFVDMNDHYIGDRDFSTNLPGTSSGPSLSDLVLRSGLSSSDGGSNPLAAASPMVSGMGPFHEITDINCSVTVKVNENDVDRVKEVIRSMGGELDDPNVSGRKAISRAGFDLESAITKLNDDTL